ncbi:beta-galactosidase small subunit-related protein [Sinomicrobium soli]|uniref:hypothetical protein n=1 Tax=Sinomicrobium sp. N-1-3-6 TaxID=2219864 RepID=UPI001374F19F
MVSRNLKYADRKTEKTETYSPKVDSEWADYSRPQENGYKTDTRWVEVTDHKGMGLRFTGKTLFWFWGDTLYPGRYGKGGLFL